MAKTTIKSVNPITAKLRTRRQPDIVPFGECVQRYYFGTADGTLVRAHGYKRFLDCQDYCNQDLHDQLLSSQLFRDTENGPLFLRDTQDQVINSLFSFKDSYGARFLLAATQSRIYQLNEATGNWRLLADNLEERPTDTRFVGNKWRFAYLNDYVIASNGNGNILYYIVNSDNSGLNLNAFSPVADLINVNISRAKVVIAYKGYILLMNTYSGGRPLPGLITWSHKHRPLVYDPLNQLAGNAVSSWLILPGHSILAATEYNGNLVLFTDKGILSGDETGGVENPFTFAFSYQSDIGHRCLAFPNTLVNTGDFLLYAGRDDIYVMSATSFGPESIDWIREASGKMYSEINTSECDAHVAGHNPMLHEIWISYCSGNRHIPDRTLVLNYKYQTAYYRSEGYSAFCNYQRDERPSFRDFLASICACTGDDMAQLYIKEGRPCKTQICNDPPLYVYTSESLTIQDPNYPEEPLITENWDASFASGRSVCALLKGSKPSDFCADCNEQSLFIGVETGDNTIKEIDPETFYLHKCSSANRHGMLDNLSTIVEPPKPGDYVKIGYNSHIAFGPFTLNNHRTDVCIQNIILHIEPEETDEYSKDCMIGVTLGTSSVPVDLNSRHACGIKWQPTEFRKMQCVENIRATSGNERPNVKFNIPVYIVGNYLYMIISISGPKNDLLAVGGKSRWYSLEISFQQRQ